MMKKKNYDERAIKTTLEQAEVPQWHLLDLSDHKEHEKLIVSATKAIEVYSDMPRTDNRSGGFLCIHVDGPTDLVPVLIRGIGKISKDNRHRHARNIPGTTESFYKLCVHKFYETSNQQIVSKDCPGYIGFPQRDNSFRVNTISFKGLSYTGNECIVAWVAIENGYMTTDEAMQIYGQYNICMKPFLEKMGNLDK